MRSEEIGTGDPYKTMKISLSILLLFAFLITEGLACFGGLGKKVTKKPTGPTPRPGEVTPRPDGNTIPPDLGDDPLSELGVEDIQPMEDTGFDANGGQADDAADLKCDFESQGSCCWKNAQPPEDVLDFIHVTAKDPPTSKAEKYSNDIFGTSQAPKGKFATTFSTEGDPSEQRAIYMSCTLECVQEPPIVRAKVWKSPGTEVEACIMPEGGEPHSCKPFEGSPPNMEVELSPFDQPHHIVILARGFREKNTVVMMDDIEVDAPPCEEPTQPPDENTTPDPDKGGGGPICDLKSDFKKGAKDWEPSEDLPTDVDFVSNKGDPLVGNPNTGAKTKDGYPESEDFIAAAVRPGNVAAVESKPFKTDKPVTITFWFQEAIKDAQLKCCINDDTNCPFESNQGIEVEDREWLEGQVDVEPSDEEQKIIFICDNSSGDNHGSCGVGQIDILDENGDPLC